MLLIVAPSFLLSAANTSNDDLFQRIQKHVDELSKIGNLGKTPEEGFTRAAWSNEESRAFNYIKNVGISFGLIAKYDGLGNLYLSSPGSWPKMIMLGSHLDTVPGGGNYDGVAGVVAALEAIRELQLRGNLKNGLELVVWRGEESATFEEAYKGSKGAFGISFTSDVLNNSFNGKTLEQAIKKQGFDPSYIKLQKPTLTKEEISRATSYLELHIEQGKVLESEQKEIGIVTGIRGAKRLRVEVAGEFDHSGATPMGTKYRKDANLTMAYMQVELDKLLKKETGNGNELVQTVGIINDDKNFNVKSKIIYNNTATKVSGYGYFVLDIRGYDNDALLKYVEKAKSVIEDTAKKMNTKVKIYNIGSSVPIESLDESLKLAIEKSAKRLGYSYQFLPSGAGHDAAVIAGTGIPVGMIFIPCKNGKSHTPEEFTSVESITKGARVLIETITSLQ